MARGKGAAKQKKGKDQPRPAASVGKTAQAASEAGPAAKQADQKPGPSPPGFSKDEGSNPASSCKLEGPYAMLPVGAHVELEVTEDGKLIIDTTVYSKPFTPGTTSPLGKKPESAAKNGPLKINGVEVTAPPKPPACKAWTPGENVGKDSGNKILSIPGPYLVAPWNSHVEISQTKDGKLVVITTPAEGQRSYASSASTTPSSVSPNISKSILRDEEEDEVTNTESIAKLHVGQNNNSSANASQLSYVAEKEDEYEGSQISSHNNKYQEENETLRSKDSGASAVASATGYAEYAGSGAEYEQEYAGSATGFTEYGDGEECGDGDEYRGQIAAPTHSGATAGAAGSFGTATAYLEFKHAGVSADGETEKLTESHRLINQASNPSDAPTKQSCVTGDVRTS